MRMLSLFMIFMYWPAMGIAQLDAFAKIRALRSEGKLEEALSSATQQLDQSKTSGETELLQMFQGLLFMDLGRENQAEETFRSLLSKNSLMTEYVLMNLAQISLKQRQHGEALKYLKDILKQSPNAKMRRDTQLQIAKILNSMNLAQSFKEARGHLRYLEKSNRRKVIYPDIIYELARTEKGLGNTPQFCKWVKKLYAYYPENPLVEKWGIRLEKNTLDDKPVRCSTLFSDKKNRIRNLQWANLGERAKNEILQLKEGSEKEKEIATELEVFYLLHENEGDAALNILKTQYEEKKNDVSFLLLVASAAAKVNDQEAAAGSYYLAYKKKPKGKQAKQALFQAALIGYQYQDYDGAQKKFREFLKVYPLSPMSRDAKWYLAWLLYLKEDYEGAYKALVELKKMAGRTRRTSLDRVQYWMGMSLYRMEKYSEARLIFEQLARDKLLGYYYWAATSRLKKVNEINPGASQEGLTSTDNSNDPKESLTQTVVASDWNRNDEEIPPLDQEPGDEESEFAQEDSPSVENEKLAFNSRLSLVKRFERARGLVQLSLQDWAKWDLFDIERKTSDREQLKALMHEYESVESYSRSSYIGQVIFAPQRALYGISGDKSLWEYTYPKAYVEVVKKYSKNFDVPTEFIWAIMRAESLFEKEVVSPVGAVGLMQLMPLTAQKVAGLMGEKNFDIKKLLLPEESIKIGTRYLQRQLKEFDGHISLAAAAYNAGPHRVNSWLSSFGPLDTDEFIEHIPYLETRNYVKKVITNFLIYSRLYSRKKEKLVELSDTLSKVSVSRDSLSNKNTLKESWDDI